MQQKSKKTLPLFRFCISFYQRHQPAPSSLSETEINAKEKRLEKGLGHLKHTSNPLLDRIPNLGVDHVFTTNYGYSIENAFYPVRNIAKASVRTSLRFILSFPDKDGKIRTEREYRLHAGYEGKNTDGTRVGIWHLHGETGVPRGIIVGHDRYGRLLSRIEALCREELRRFQNEEQRQFRSWPELFLYGDVYILGFGFLPCEYDLWWLLRRKQREHYADGHVYYFDNDNENEESVALRYLLLESHGVQINPLQVKKQKNYLAFYDQALDAIAEHVRTLKS